MDPRDDLDSLAAGVDCAACGEFVPANRVRILARRDDVAFVEIACPACSSDSLGIVVAAPIEPRVVDAGEDMRAVGPGHPYGEWGAADEERFREALPIGVRDLEAVRSALARGGLSALVGDSEPPLSPGR
jgi:hypothetical protein